MALAATQQYYPVDHVAQRILPALCLLTLDPEKNVRDAVFRVSKGFMGKLEKLSEDPSLREEMESEVCAASSGLEGGSGWAGWAVGTLTSKFYKSAISSALSSNTAEKKEEVIKPDNKPAKQIYSPSGNNVETTLAARDHEGDGWGHEEDWKPIEEAKSPSVASKQPEDSEATTGDGWMEDEEEWGSLEGINSSAGAPNSDSGNLSSSTASVNKSSSYNSWSSGTTVKDPDSDDFFDSIKSETVSIKFIDNLH